jgi:hypothetical protein
MCVSANGPVVRAVNDGPVFGGAGTHHSRRDAPYPGAGFLPSPTGLLGAPMTTSHPPGWEQYLPGGSAYSSETFYFSDPITAGTQEIPAAGLGNTAAGGVFPVASRNTTVTANVAPIARSFADSNG